MPRLAGCDNLRLSAIEDLPLKGLASSKAYIRGSLHGGLKPKSGNFRKIQPHGNSLQPPRRTLGHFPFDPPNPERIFVDPCAAGDQLLLFTLWRQTDHIKTSVVERAFSQVAESVVIASKERC